MLVIIFGGGGRCFFWGLVGRGMGLLGFVKRDERVVVWREVGERLCLVLVEVVVLRCLVGGVLVILGVG